MLGFSQLGSTVLGAGDLSFAQTRRRFGTLGGAVLGTPLGGYSRLSTQPAEEPSDSILGAAAITEADDTVVATGVVRVTGSAGIAEAGDTLTAAGTVRVSGAAAITEAGDTLAATATVRVTGSGGGVEADDTLTATAAVIVPGAGTANITEANDTLTAAGTCRITGTAPIVEADDTSQGTGTVRVSGSASITEADDTSAEAPAAPPSSGSGGGITYRPRRSSPTDWGVGYFPKPAPTVIRMELAAEWAVSEEQAEISRVVHVSAFDISSSTEREGVPRKSARVEASELAANPTVGSRSEATLYALRYAGAKDVSALSSRANFVVSVSGQTEAKSIDSGDAKAVPEFEPGELEELAEVAMALFDDE